MLLWALWFTFHATLCWKRLNYEHGKSRFQLLQLNGNNFFRVQWKYVRINAVLHVEEVRRLVSMVMNFYVFTVNFLLLIYAGDGTINKLFFSHCLPSLPAFCAAAAAFQNQNGKCGVCSILFLHLPSLLSQEASPI